jgi:hypothetical protein
MSRSLLRAPTIGQFWPHVKLTPMLTPMHTQTAHVTHAPGDAVVNILCQSNANAHYILWPPPLTNRYEFHLYYDI